MKTSIIAILLGLLLYFIIEDTLKKLKTEIIHLKIDMENCVK